MVSSSQGTLFAGSYEGRILSFSSTGNPTPLQGDGHSGQVTSLATSDNTVFSAGFDDRVREINTGQLSFS